MLLPENVESFFFSIDRLKSRRRTVFHVGIDINVPLARKLE